MQLIDCKALEPDLIRLRILDSATANVKQWNRNTEVQLITDNDREFLVHGDLIVPVEYADRSDKLRFGMGLWLWCLINADSDELRLRVLACSGALNLDLDIGVDDRLVDQLHAQQRITRPDPTEACTWLCDELLLGRLNGMEGARALARSDGNRSRLTLVGRRHEADLSERDGCWRIERLAPTRTTGGRGLVLLDGNLNIVDVGVAAALRSPAHRRQFQEYLDAHGDYVDLWHRYARIEWEKATEAGRELGILHYKSCEPAGAEELQWTFKVDPEQGRAFIDRWRVLVQSDRRVSKLIEACPEPPAWMRDDREIRTEPSGRPVIGESPELDGDGLTLSYASDRRHDAPPPRGVLCLSVHGERKVHERRESALECVRTSANPMPQLRILLEGQPVPIRAGWRKELALSSSARAAFRGTPTERQQRALDTALNTPDLAVIIGPPGTGKTQVISALQRRLREIFPDPSVLQYQILITSFQHDAVDNALDRMEDLGLPPQRSGGRRRGQDDEGTDHQMGWCLRQYGELQPKLEAAIAAEPAFALLMGLRDDATRLRIQPLSPPERAALARKLGIALQQLADEHGLRPAAATETRWRAWLAAQGEAFPATRAEAMPSRCQWRRALWSLRVTESAFADDGQRQCLRLLDLANRLEIVLSKTDFALLDALSMALQPSREQLAGLAALRERYLAISRPDYRPPELRTALDREGGIVLDELLANLDASLRRRPEWAHLTVIRDYLDDLRLDPQRIEAAVRAYTTVVGATCQQAASDPMKKLLGLAPNDHITFDTVVIDEAARATPLDLLIPMAMGRRRIVLVGDHRQLPHLLDPATEDELERTGELREAEHRALRESLFERLVGGLRRLEREYPEQPRRVVMLDTQFRMHPVLGDFVSRTFYESAGEDSIRSGRPPEDFVHAVPGLEGRVCAWIDVPAHEGNTRDRKVGGSRVREVEAVHIAQEARHILDTCPELSVGVITFYAAQRDLILERMANVGLAEYRDDVWRVRPEWKRDARGKERLHVGTVDAFQGMEFDVVLLSIVRTDKPLQGENADRESALTRKYGFLRLPNRLNVAMSRQQRLLIAVGDAALARAPEAAEAAPGLSAFLNLCEGDHGRVL
jgi:hypothetical protein